MGVRAELFQPIAHGQNPKTDLPFACLECLKKEKTQNSSHSHLDGYPNENQQT
jgi:hypothetical protein